MASWSAAAISAAGNALPDALVLARFGMLAVKCGRNATLNRAFNLLEQYRRAADKRRIADTAKPTG